MFIMMVICILRQGEPSTCFHNFDLGPHSSPVGIFITDDDTMLESVSGASQKGCAGLKLRSPDSVGIFFLREAGKYLWVVSEQKCFPVPFPTPGLLELCLKVGAGKESSRVPRGQLPVATPMLIVDM